MINFNFLYNVRQTVFFEDFGIYICSVGETAGTSQLHTAAGINPLENITQTGLEVQFTKSQNASQVIVAVYNSDVELLNPVMKSTADNGNNFDIAIPREDGTEVKAMIWNDMATMKPDQAVTGKLFLEISNKCLTNVCAYDIL